ncbi:ABC transporter ATP-binding protein [Saccharibacillus sacchari]|uniref:ABC transporter ATP-binding protein n=1 Tax=Saccharibacillus sacchari TaxID=456493 RepID=A0ACC6P9J9_9BACL
MVEVIVEVDHVSMQFNLYKERVDSIKEYMIKMFKKQMVVEPFVALKDVSFKVEKGDSLALLGMNGSGKSTLLKLIAGVLKPTTGSIKTVGAIAPMIELGAGFDVDLTARENIFLNGAVLGYSRADMESHFDSIIDFSELHDFVDVPIKNFSSGMLARLGFSIATVTQPDILIIDEILSVGDYKFQEKCEIRIHEMMQAGTTVLFVSHSIEQIKEICNKAVYIEKGRMLGYGDVHEICDRYMV